MSKNKLGITEGTAFSSSKQRGKPNHCIAAQVFNEDTGLSVCHFNATKKEQEATNNANVCADALEIANKHGLYPTQLLEQRDDLLEALKRIREYHLFDINEDGEPNASALDVTDNWFKVSKLIQSIEK